MKKYRWLIVVVLAFAMIAAACGDGEADDGDGATTTAADGGDGGATGEVSVFGAFSGIEAAGRPASDRRQDQCR